jgi:hypothetical protein
VKKKASARFEGCTFVGKSGSKGVEAYGNITISQSQFTGFYLAVELKQAGEVSIKSNAFVNNRTAIYLASQSSEPCRLSLQCNMFEQTDTIPENEERIGIRIGKEATIANNRLGGDAGYLYAQLPNGNYFPRMGLGFSPDPVPRYISIKNESEAPIVYWAYQNEFLGTTKPQFDGSKLNYVMLKIAEHQYIVTQRNIKKWCLDNNNCDEPDLAACQQNLLSSTVCSNGLQFRMPCMGGPLDNIEWPLTLPRADTSLVSQVKQQEFLYGRHPALSNPIPNPARDVVEFLYFIPSDAKGRRLEITEATTGKVVKHVPVEQMGQHMATILLQGLPAGVYACRLVLESGKMPPVQRFVINR